MNTGNRQNTKYKLFGGYGLFSSKKPPTKSSSDINNTFEVVKDESTMKFEIKTLIEIVERRVNDKVHYDYYTNMDHLLQIDGIKYTTDRLIELLPKKQLKNPTFVPESILFEKKFGIKCDDQMTAAKYFKPLMVEKFSKIEHSIELFQFLKVNGASASTYLYDRKKDGIAFEILQDLTKFLNTYQFVEPLIG
ncbi:hypothetical protein FQR65_LT19332 [Abscondita terminalis]|nr:hypothetical protein FQR65_LT19332 [Abscondita terminalis]